MVYIYFLVSAVAIVLLNNFFEIFKQSYSWWLVPVLLIGFVLILIILQMAVLLGMIQFTNVEKPADKRKPFFRFILKISLPIILGGANVKIISKGTEKLPKDGRFLFICNHQHDFDPVIIMKVFPDAELSFIGKKDIYADMPFIAKAMHLLGGVPIDRENDREAAKAIIKCIKKIKDDTDSIAVFPEGYTNLNPKENTLLPFRNGSFKIALKTGVPIVVCVINNTREIPKNLIRRRTVVDFRLIDVVNPEDYENMNTQDLGAVLHEKMEAELNLILGK